MDKSLPVQSGSPEGRAEVERVAKSFHRFVPSQMIKLLGRDCITDVLLGDQVEGNFTVMFSDIRDFTSMVELLTPGESMRFINSYLDQMEALVSDHNGIIDKFIGDAIMAIFPESPEDAMECSLAMLRQLDNYNLDRIRAGHSLINIGIGLNTGLCVFGTVGGKRRMEGTVIGDVVNISSRLESETKKYGVQLLIGENTFYGISGKHNVRFIDRVLMKGKSRPQSIYEVFDCDPPEIRRLKSATKPLFEEALAYYHYRKVDAARHMLEKCLRLNPGDRPARFYLDRCVKFELTGVYECDSELNQKLEWSSEFEAGIPATDRQHRQLFKISVELLDKLGSEDKTKELERVVSFLDDYIMEHFRTEERIMTEAKYPFLKHQQEQHVRFIENFGMIKKEIAERKQSSIHLMFKIQVFLIDWLINHTMKKDRHFGRYLKGIPKN